MIARHGPNLGFYRTAREARNRSPSDQTEPGAPLRLRNEIELGFKQVKWLAGIEFVAHFSEVAGGHGGYNQDHEFFGYGQSI